MFGGEEARGYADRGLHMPYRRGGRVQSRGVVPTGKLAPEFLRPPPRQFRNPFTGGTMTVHPAPDAADIVLEGQTVGAVYWSMSEKRLVNVSIEPSALPLVHEWAATLAGEFRPRPAS